MPSRPRQSDTLVATTLLVLYPLVGVSCELGGRLGNLGSDLMAGVRSALVEELALEVTLSPDLNRGAPLGVDLVIVYEQELLDQIVELSAADWFAQRGQLRLDHPTGFDFWQWEWVPGQQVPTRKVIIQARRSLGGVIFANYFQPGTHRARVDVQKPVTLQFGEDSFTMRNP